MQQFRVVFDRQGSLLFAPASASFSTPMICSSVNRFPFIVRSYWGGLQSYRVLMPGVRSHWHYFWMGIYSAIGGLTARSVAGAIFKSLLRRLSSNLLNLEPWK